MNKITCLAVVFPCWLLLCMGCSDVLDEKKELNSISDKDVWANPKYATAYLDALHATNIPGWDYSNSSDCDEAGPDRGVSGHLFGQLTSNSVNTWPYSNIRNICLFLEGIDQTSSFDGDIRDRLRAQALVIRAWVYFSMVRLYGGVPMILNSQKLSDDLYVTRTKTSECIRLIIKDLDDAIAVSDANFPYTWTGDDAGRITKAAALALKGRILLYWASPQFNPTNLQDRWQAAYDANKEAKELLEQHGYGLYESFSNVWFDEMNKEAVFVKRYQHPNMAHSWEAGTRPYESYLQLSGFNKPTWELASSFPMITGEPVTESAVYDDVLFWKNRDPRFAATIVWNSCIYDLYGSSGRRQWTYNESSNPSSTYMYCRKAIHEEYTTQQASAGYNSGDWIEIRFAEVLMNYAECAAETGKNDEAYDVLKQRRNRAGIIAGSNGLYGLKANMSKEEMISAVMLERKIEFAFEGKRFWDLRRRRLFASELNGKQRHGRLPKLNIPMEEFNEIRDEVNFYDDYGQYFTDEIVQIDNVYTINFLDNYYFYAIPNSHLETNSNLEQTQGWENGAFNPLE
ncbi:MAG: RagB/SusD family nutrient uptake outer membrane protein [Tannerellaceae bacterium]|nr:RagB/SusD family nutrient uptake outer membrane protein [Tannerellaceae bacterium]